MHNIHVVRDLEPRGDRRGLAVIDVACPLVSKVHAEARRFDARGDTIVLIGHRGHKEVESTMDEAPEAIQLVESAEDVEFGLPKEVTRP